MSVRVCVCVLMIYQEAAKMHKEALLIITASSLCPLTMSLIGQQCSHTHLPHAHMYEKILHSLTALADCVTIDSGACKQDGSNSSVLTRAKNNLKIKHETQLSTPPVPLATKRGTLYIVLTPSGKV